MVSTIKKIVIISNYIGAAFLFVLMAIITVDVILRFLGFPMRGFFELSELVLALAVWGGLAYTTMQNGHVKIELIVSRFSSRVQDFIDLIGNILGLGLFVAIMWKGATSLLLSKKVGEVSMALGIPIYPFKLVIPLGALLVCLVLLLMLFNIKLSTDEEEE